CQRPWDGWDGYFGYMPQSHLKMAKDQSTVLSPIASAAGEALAKGAFLAKEGGGGWGCGHLGGFGFSGLDFEFWPRLAGLWHFRGTLWRFCGTYAPSFRPMFIGSVAHVAHVALF